MPAMEERERPVEAMAVAPHAAKHAAQARGCGLPGARSPFKRCAPGAQGKVG